jgi:hypothetical protein
LVVVDDVLPLGLVVVVVVDPEPVAEGEVELPVDPLTEPEPVVLLLPGVVVVVVLLLPGDAEGGVRSGVLPTRSVSVRLHATVEPASSARAQRPDSILFITMLLLVGSENQRGVVQPTCPRRADLTALVPSNTTASYLAAPTATHPRARRVLQ